MSGEVLRIGNCSGFYGDRLTAMREMLEGGDLDVLTADYLSELTMLTFGRETLGDASLGYARTFVRQVEDCLGLALQRGVKIVANAGGLNPAGLADRLRQVAARLGLQASVVHVEGDDVRDLAAFPGVLTANAYLGGFGIARALTEGADVVVTGRVSDASLVVGPAVARFGWTPEQYDELAGAVVAGHVLECGAQATGGNFSGFLDIPRDRPLGFPIAEVRADGSSVITKHDGTGGAVTVDTVTAQLLYEIQSTRYLNPDVTAHLDTVQLTQAGPDRVEVSRVQGSPPPARLKVAVNELGGFRNTLEFVLTGLDIEEKAAWVRSQVDQALAANPPASVTWTPLRAVPVDADTEEGASALLRCTVKDPKPEPVGKPFTSAVVEIALASYPGFTLTAPPPEPTPYGVYRAAYVDRADVTQTVVLGDGTRIEVADPHVGSEPTGEDREGARFSPYPAPQDSITRRLPLGSFVHARSGDKGGNANIGLWVKHDGSEKYAARVTWLIKLMSPRKVRELVHEAAELDVDVFMLPNLGGVNVVIHGLLGEGVAASTRFDPQAKALGEWIRSRVVNIEDGLL